MGKLFSKPLVDFLSYRSGSPDNCSKELKVDFLNRINNGIKMLFMRCSNGKTA